jgi:hypothetical protein
MVPKNKLTIKKQESIVYTIKAGKDIIWEGADIHKKFPILKAANRDKELSIICKSTKRFLKCLKN